MLRCSLPISAAMEFFCMFSVGLFANTPILINFFRRFSLQYINI